MARIAHRRVLLRLYEDVPQHQEILRWLDGYSGRGLQEILRGALLIGLPRLLESQPSSIGGATEKQPVRKAEPPLSLPNEETQQTSQVIESDKYAVDKDVARRALSKIFED